jgi:hypothetical protein
MVYPSINLHCSIYLPDKQPAGKEANSAGHAEEAVRDNGHVSKIHGHRDIACDVQLCPEIEHGV